MSGGERLGSPEEPLTNLWIRRGTHHRARRRLSHPEAFAVGNAQHLPAGATEVDEPLSHDASKLLIPNSP
jgi:hypothetical protein